MVSAQGPNISMIVPVWGDDKILAQLLEAPYLRTNSLEWIVAAVEPGPELKKLESQGIIRLLICEKPSRGEQMNAGAKVATGRMFCFHHADTEFTNQHLEALIKAEADPSVKGGAFHRRFDNRHPLMRFWERFLQNVNTSFSPLFGDQSIFVRAEAFHLMGGFAEIPLMEDLEFSGRLRKRSGVRLLHPAISTSARRFDQLGSLRTSLFNGLLISLFYLGFSPESLHQWYYADRHKSVNPVQ